MNNSSTPTNWKTVTFETLVADTQLGTTERGEDEGGSSIDLIKMGNLTWGGLALAEVERVSLRKLNGQAELLQVGDLLFNTRNSADLVGKSAIWRDPGTPTTFDNNINRIRLFDFAHPDFFGAYLNTGVGKKSVQSLAVGSTSVAAIYWKDLRKLKVPLPPLPEQRKIAEILRTWDEAIEKLEALRAAKAHQLEGFTAHLICGAQAAPQHLREHTSEVSERNRGQCVERILSVTNSAGFVLAEDQFAHRVASADTSNYKIVRQGQYAYNPSRINVGSIARLDGWSEGALSPMYVVFELRDTLDSDFFSHWLRSGEARKRIALAAQGSVRDTVSFGDLGSIQLPLPPIEEQRRIARALSAMKEELSLLDKEIEALARQKRGLMQKLLTGEWRVKAGA